jgi:L-ribulose-5-phosphate 3-epimerase UlaE
MLSQNVINPEKMEKIKGSVFHLFYMDLNNVVLFDSDLNVPIIWGGKTIVIGHLKKIDEQMRVKPTAKVRIYSYILGTEGFRRIQTYNGPIETIGKYLIRY